MKRIFIYILTAVVFFGLTGCREEANVFDQSAAERLQNYEQTLRKNLTSQSNGWEMRYFPTVSSAGYPLLMKFNANGEVLVAAKNPVSSRNIYAEETSLWGISSNQGCVLSFHSYNELLSVFADPGSDGIGHGGDYEFVVLQNDSNYIRLLGKKHGAYITMEPVPDAMTWKGYFDAVDSYNDNLFADNDGIDLTYFDGKNETPLSYTNGTISYKNKAGEDVIQGIILTPTGLHMYSGLMLADSTRIVNDFVLTEDKSALVSTDGTAFITSNYTAADFFAFKFTKYSRWKYVEDGTDAATVTALQALESAAEANGATVHNLAYERTILVNSRGTKTYSYSLYLSYRVAEGKVFGGRIKLDYTKTDTTITLQYKGYEEALRPFFARIDANPENAAQQFADIFCGTFTPESYTGSKINMTQLNMKKADGSNIHVMAEKIIM